MADSLIRAVYRPSSIRLVAAVTTDLCREAGRRHQASPAVTCALSRALSGGLLLATLTRGGERVTVQFAGDGPVKGLTVDAYGSGDVRGYAARPEAWAGRSMAGRQRLRGLVGDGVVNILRDLGLRDRYQGQVSLSTGEIDEDIEAYLRGSEQIPSALGCEVVMDEAGTVLCAGGILAQVMPGGDEDRIHELHHLLRTGALYDALTGETAQGMTTPAGLIEALLPDLAAGIETLDGHELRFRCQCSVERIEGMLKTVGPVELDEMIAEGSAEITCNYCNQVYHLSAEDLLRVREQLAPREKN
jgi:molecular chaperone Hsp33